MLFLKGSYARRFDMPRADIPDWMAEGPEHEGACREVRQRVAAEHRAEVCRLQADGWTPCDDVLADLVHRVKVAKTLAGLEQVGEILDEEVEKGRVSPAGRIALEAFIDGFWTVAGDGVTLERRPR